MDKKNSKKARIVGAVGAAVAASAGAGMSAEAIYIDIYGQVPEGFTDANGNLCGYYNEEGKWVQNKLQWQFHYNKAITLKIYKVSDDVDLSEKTTYTLNKNTVDSKICIQDANNRRIIPGAVLQAKDAQGNVVATYTTDITGFVYYDELPIGTYTLEAISLPDGYSFEPVQITRFEYVEDVKFDGPMGNGWVEQMGLTLPTGTYVIWWKDFTDYVGFQELYADTFYKNNHPHQLVLKMKGYAGWAAGSMGQYQSNVEVGYVAYEIDKDGNDLGVVQGVGASVEKFYNIDGSHVDYQVATNKYGLASLTYSGKEPENYEYLFDINSIPEGLMLRYPQDSHFSWVPAAGIHGDTLIAYIPLIATSDVQLKVYDQKTGKCIEGAKVQVLDEQGNPVANKHGVSVFTTTGADENGYNCLLDDLMVGNYQVKIIELPDDGTEDGYAYPTTTTAIESTKGVVNNYDVPVAHNGFVKVTVIDADSKEVLSRSDITVKLYKNNASEPFATLTIDEFETYYRQGKIVEDTSIKVELCFPTNVYTLTSVTRNTEDGTTDLSWNKTGTYQNMISTVLSRDGFDLTYALTVRTGSIDITVRDKDTKEPIANAKVEIYDANGKVVATKTTTTDGKIYVDKVIPGAYTAKVVDPTNKYLPSDEILTLNVVVEDTTRGILELTRDCGYVKVSVKELLQNGTLATFNKAVNLVIKDSTGKTVHTYSTDNMGNAAALLLDSDNYTVVIQDALTGYTILEINGKAFTVSNGTTETVDLRVQRDRSDLTVTVRDKLTNEIIPGATVTVTDSDGGKHTAISDENGVVYFDKIPTGTVTIETTDVPENYTADKPVTATIVKDTSATATIYVNRDRGQLFITSYIAGTDTVLPNCTVEVIDMATGKTYTTTKTGTNGQAILLDVPTGNYKVVITEAPARYDPVTDATVELLKGQNAHARVEAKREAGKLQVVVKDGKGTPETNDDIMLKNVDVLITELETGKTYNVKTDANGQFTTDFLPTGNYKVEVTGGLSYIYTIPAAKEAEIFYKDEPTVVVFNLTEDKNALHVQVVEEGTNTPLANISVTLSNGETYVTDEYGYIHIPEILVGEYVASVDGDKIPNTHKTNNNSSKAVTVTKNVEGRVVLELTRKKGDLDVTVRDKDTDEPIPGAKVEIYDEDGNKVGEGTTDENGKLIVDDLPTGDYTIKVTEVPDGYNKPDDTTVTIEDEQTSETVILVEKKKGDLDIAVKDKDTNESIPNAKVEVYDKDGNKVGEGVTDENGKLIVEDLPIGDYTIKVTEVPDGYNKPDDTIVTVEEDKTAEAVILIEKKKGDLDITVKDKDTDEPIPGAKVEIYDEDGNKVGEGTTDENGKLIVEDLPIGDYTIKVTEVPDGYNKPDDTTVTVEEDKTTDVVIEVEKKKGDLDITVKDKDTDEPIPGAKVEILDKDGNKVSEGTTDENGKLIVEDLPIGDYTIKVTEVPDGYSKPDDTTVTVEEDKTTETVITVEKQKGDLNITVKDKDTQELIPNAKVEIYDEDGNKVGESVTDENGKLIVEDLPIGDYTIKVTEVPDGYNKPDDTTVTVEDKKTTETVILVEKKKGDLDITVKDKDTDEPIPGAKVEILDKDGNKVSEGTTDENGKLIIEDLPIGDYTIKVTEVPDGYNKPDDTTVTVEEDKTTDVVITVEKQKGDLDITVKDKDTDELIPNAKVEILDKDGNKVGEGITDENGKLIIEDLPIGDYTIKVTEVPDGYNKPDDTIVTVEDEKITETVIKIEKQKGNLKVTVVDKESKLPLENALVAIVDKDGNIVKTTKTDSNGNVYLEAILAGTYTVEVLEAPDGYTAPAATQVVVENKKTTEHIIELTRDKGNLSILVEDKETKELLPNVVVVVKDKDGNAVGEYTTNENGQVLVQNLPTGDYTVEVKEYPETYKTPTTYTTSVEKDETSNVVISLEKAKGSLTMVAKEKDTSNYMKDVEFEVYDKDGNLIGTFTSDENGTALAEALVVGRYSVKVTKVPEGFKLPANAKELEIVEDMNTTVVFELERVEENVQTGDNSNVGLYGLLAGASAIGIFATRKKKDKNIR